VLDIVYSLIVELHRFDVVQVSLQCKQASPQLVVPHLRCRNDMQINGSVRYMMTGTETNNSTEKASLFTLIL
jgi:hypothetical protein